jgi:hypothetical protein
LDDDSGPYGEDVNRAERLLPAWFITRMMTDDWSFAFLMVTGDLVHLTCIEAVHLGADGIWLDVSLSERTDIQGKHIAGRHIGAPTERTRASINARHIVMAFETAYT